MRATGVLQKTAIFGALGVALSIIPTAGVSASATSASGQRELSDRCEETAYDDYYGDVRVFYTPDGINDDVDEIKYYLGARGNAKLGKKSNVRLRIRESLADRPDRTLWSWESGDDIKPGWHSKDPYRQVEYKKRWHVDVKFIFDVTGYDPRCTATTNKA
ncbi:hypothetical protein ETD86_49025 [Nonomuraea turkmeniaca]|uniref:PLAT domain-containing protein n=1 Tax=Nonomuraea turkmeniaca TaxID=103838 RepID=A0A5S4FGQ7_9ACTN|nr:hypothetical protein [Nonomuraea turkmeniaca]TMR08164.1 hypothetical protein ETD86_49025 [Nonomuraea turkmeniaca]